MSYFSFLKHEDSEKAMKELDKQSQEDSVKIGEQIVKLAESDALSDLDILCLEARPIIKFLKSYIYEAFLSAVHMRNTDIVEFFLKHGLNISDEPLNESIMLLTKVAKWSVHDPPVEILTLLLDNEVDVNYMEKKKFRTPLVYACKQGNLEFVKILTQRGADVNVVDKENKTPLGHVEEKIKANPEREEYKQIKEFLVKNGAKAKWNE